MMSDMEKKILGYVDDFNVYNPLRTVSKAWKKYIDSTRHFQFHIIDFIPVVDILTKLFKDNLISFRFNKNGLYIKSLSTTMMDEVLVDANIVDSKLLQENLNEQIIWLEDQNYTINLNVNSLKKIVEQHESASNILIISFWQNASLVRLLTKNGDHVLNQHLELHNPQQAHVERLFLPASCLKYEEYIFHYHVSRLPASKKYIYPQSVKWYSGSPYGYIKIQYDGECTYSHKYHFTKLTDGKYYCKGHRIDPAEKQVTHDPHVFHNDNICASLNSILSAIPYGHSDGIDVNFRFYHDDKIMHIDLKRENLSLRLTCIAKKVE